MFDWINTCKKYRAVRQLISREGVKRELSLPNPNMPIISLGDALRFRRSTRSFSSESMSLQELSNLLWCADGVNKVDDNQNVLRTAPTANNHQEIDLYVFDANGGYRYEAKEHSLKQLFTGDIRSYIGTQPFVENAPIIICITADYSRMVRHNSWKKHRYSCVDAGYVSQNIYLYCAAAKLATVACGKINRDLIKKILGIKDGDVILCHPVG